MNITIMMRVKYKCYMKKCDKDQKKEWNYLKLLLVQVRLE